MMTTRRVFADGREAEVKELPVETPDVCCIWSGNGDLRLVGLALEGTGFLELVLIPEGGRIEVDA